MKRLCLLFILVLSLCVFASCNLLPGKEDIQAEDTTAALKTPEELKAEVEASNKEFRLKLDNIEAESRAKREDALTQFMEQNKSEHDSLEKDRLARDGIENARFQERQQFLNGTELNKINQIFSTELKKISQEYDADIVRISKEYDATMEKIDAEYNIRIQEISTKYMDSTSQASQEASDLNKAEQEKISQEGSAEKKRISQEYTALLKKAEQEKTAQNNSDQNKAVIEKKYQSLSQAVEKVQKAYADSIQDSKNARDSAKAAFKKESTKKYNDSFNRLVSEKAIDKTKWEALIRQEIKELSDYYAEQDKKYNDSVIKMSKWRNDEIPKLLN